MKGYKEAKKRKERTYNEELLSKKTFLFSKYTENALNWAVAASIKSIVSRLFRLFFLIDLAKVSSIKKLLNY